MPEHAESGKLYLVPTPIGNLEDITLRAIRTLREVNAIMAEDTRTTGRLLQHLGISNHLESFHAHNEHSRLFRIVDRLAKGENLALVSDAGTPGISDPGFLLVRACLEAGIAVECLPGATAFVPALIKSGFPADSFVFDGFLPHKKGRQTKFKQMAEEVRTIVLYESPHRILKTLHELNVLMPERKISVSRELTKIYEETITGLPQELINHFETHPVKGEFVLVIDAVK